jgi:hypothetical protein
MYYIIIFILALYVILDLKYKLQFEITNEWTNNHRNKYKYFVIWYNTGKKHHSTFSRNFIRIKLWGIKA